MARKTKVRIVGDPELASKVRRCIQDHFELDQDEKYDRMPTRYGSYGSSPGVTYYLSIKKSRG